MRRSTMKREAECAKPAAGSARHDDSHAWVATLRGPTAVREEALAELRALLLRGARFELNRSRGALHHVPKTELDAIAIEAADDALGAILANLGSFRGASRFTTWASKFVVVEAGVKSRRRAWAGRETNRDAQASSEQTVGEAETLRAIRREAEIHLTSHQREVFAAVALNGVPIDVLADRLNTTRGAMYQTLRDARRKLRAALEPSI